MIRRARTCGVPIMNARCPTCPVLALLLWPLLPACAGVEDAGELEGPASSYVLDELDEREDAGDDPTDRPGALMAEPNGGDPLPIDDLHLAGEDETEIESGIDVVEALTGEICPAPETAPDLACPDPESPQVSYLFEDVGECCHVSIHCAPGSIPFDDACGCGCFIADPATAVTG